MELRVRTAKVEDDGYCTVLAFADDPVSPSEYVILQFVNDPTEEDLALGQGGVHLEVSDQKNSGYNLIEELELTGSNLVITLNERALKVLGNDPRILLRMDASQVAEETVQGAIALFKSRLS